MSKQNAPEIFELTPAERSSSTWYKLREHLNEELEHERLRLEKEQSEMSTAAVRGKIQAIRHLLLLDEERPTTDDSPLPV